MRRQEHSLSFFLACVFSIPLLTKILDAAFHEQKHNIHFFSNTTIAQWEAKCPIVSFNISIYEENHNQQQEKTKNFYFSKNFPKKISNQPFEPHNSINLRSPPCY